MRFLAALAVLCVAAPCAIEPAIAAPPAPLAAQSAQATAMAAHRAVYTLTLASSRGGDVVAARGTMAYEVVDACDGWATRQRLEMTITNADGQDIQMTSDYATWESKDGTKFRFHMKQMTDTAVTTQTDGEASLQRPGGPGEARYTAPREQTKALPAGTLFPMVHTETILAAAREGKKFLALPLFDGTDDGGAQDSSVVILDWKQPAKSQFPMLSPLPSTRVRLAFFDREGGNGTPTYEVGMRYWENGVADDLQMDFGDFVMNGKMTELAPQPKRC